MAGDAQDWAGSLLPLLQICDSALPTGAFAHTFGMETYLERGTVSDQASFQDWLERFLDHQLLYADGLAVRLTAELFAGTTANGASAGTAPSALAAADGAASPADPPQPRRTRHPTPTSTPASSDSTPSCSPRPYRPRCDKPG